MIIRSLHRRLAALITTFTALILAGSLCVAGCITAKQHSVSSTTLLNTRFLSLLDKISNERVLSDAWIATQESSSRCLILIEDNGIPLLFSGSWKPQTERSELFAMAKKAISKGNDSLPLQQTSFALNGMYGETYKGIAAILSPDNSNSSVFVLILQEQSELVTRLRMLALQYLLLWIGGVSVLFAVAWWISGKALQPTVKSLEQQSAFVAAAGHELRSPLAVIKASLAAVREEGGLNESQTTFLSTSEREIVRMVRLTEDLLLLAGSDSRTLSIRLAAIDTDTFCIELYEQFYPLAKQLGHELTLLLPDAPLPQIYADEQRLKQLLACLITNAMDYTPSGTSIEVQAAVDNSRVKFRVIDHGRGIPDDKKSQIFNRFYRADESRTDKTHFGLGLSVAKEIAALHHATITLIDTPSSGATFELSLPISH